MKEKKYVYSIKSSVVEDDFNFVTASNIIEAVETYITWWKNNQYRNITPADITAVQLLGESLE